MTASSNSARVDSIHSRTSPKRRRWMFLFVFVILALALIIYTFMFYEIDYNFSTVYTEWRYGSSVAKVNRTNLTLVTPLRALNHSSGLGEPSSHPDNRSVSEYTHYNNARLTSTGVFNDFENVSGSNLSTVSTNTTTAKSLNETTHSDFVEVEYFAQGEAKFHKEEIVPNIAHFIWFSNHTFQFYHLLSILSVYKVMKADRILFHTDFEPQGVYWEEIKAKVPVLEIHQRDPPLKIFNQTLNPRWHQADVASLLILMEIGGVYFDPDIFVVQPLDYLRHYECVMGREIPGFVAKGIIFANKDAEFLRLYYDGYRRYDAGCWNCNSLKYPNYLAKKHPGLIHIEETSLIYPPGNRWRMMFYGKFRWWVDNFTVHVWIRNFERRDKTVVVSPETIKHMDSAFGQMCRFIYYDEPHPVDF